MKRLNTPTGITLVCGFAGLLCLFARAWLLSNGVDQNHLILTDHIGNGISWGLTVGITLLLIVSIVKASVPSFSVSTVTGAGRFVAAIGYLAIAPELLGRDTSLIQLVAGLLAISCAAASVMQGVQLWNRKPPVFFLYMPSILFFMVLMVVRYQQWSAIPQLQRYAFSLLALVSMLLGSYHRAEVILKVEKGKRYLFFSRAALFFCLSALPSASQPLFYAAMAGSILLDGCHIPVREDD